ncbi:MAG: hypothetical protein ACI8U0_002308, partial [Flavobacteriales bacterium]
VGPNGLTYNPSLIVHFHEDNSILFIAQPFDSSNTELNKSKNKFHKR